MLAEAGDSCTITSPATRRAGPPRSQQELGRVLALKALWAIRDLRKGPAHTGEQIIRAMGDDGIQPGRITRQELIRRCRCSHVTFARHCAILEQHGLIRRTYTGRLCGAGEYRHILILRLGDAYMPRTIGLVNHPEPEPRPAKPADQGKETFVPPTPPIGGSPVVVVVDHRPVVAAANRIATALKTGPAADRERDWLGRLKDLADWPRLAKARSDVPTERPGWAANLTRDRELRRQWEAEEAAAAGRPAPRRETVVERGLRLQAARPRTGVTGRDGLRDYLLARRDELRGQRSDPERARLDAGRGQ